MRFVNLSDAEKAHLAAVFKQPQTAARKDAAMNGSLHDQKVLVIGRGSGIARAVAKMSSTFLTGQTLHIDGGEPLT
jgi:NAD(P)-dependent dehydrogenase (short-subunit alcohol dehydrogenase family)